MIHISNMTSGKFLPSRPQFPTCKMTIVLFFSILCPPHVFTPQNLWWQELSYTVSVLLYSKCITLTVKYYTLLTDGLCGNIASTRKEEVCFDQGKEIQDQILQYSNRL